jgi:hypothetical protein
MIDKDMEEITKEWPAKFLVPAEDAELFDPDIIGSPLVAQVEHDRQTSMKNKKKREEVQNIETDEEDNTLEGSGPDSPTGEGGDELSQEEEGEDGEKQGKCEVTPSKDPPTEAETSRKRKFSL